MATGLEAAATLISLIGFSAQTFDGCVKAFVLLSTARNLGKDAEILRCMIDWQQLRLTQWAEKVNLHDPAGADKNLDWSLIKTTLGHLRDLLGDVGVLKARYGLILENDVAAVNGRENITRDDSISTSSSTAPARFRNLFLSQGAANPASVSASAKVIHSKNNVVKRLRWAALDKKNLERLLLDASHLTQRLYDATDAAVQTQILSSVTALLNNAASWSRSAPDLQLVNDLVRQTPQVEQNRIQSSIRKRYDDLLLQAVHNNDVLCAESLVDEGASVNATDQVGWPALVHSVKDGKVEMCEMLLRRGADPLLTTTPQTGKRLPQHFAAQEGQVEILSALLERQGVFASAHDYLDSTALHYAAKSGSDACVKLLLAQEGIEVDNEDRDGWTPLMCAMGRASLGKENATSIIRRLLTFSEINANQTLRKHGQFPLWMAATIDDAAVMEMLLARHEIDIDQRAREGETAVYRAARWSRDATLQMLIASGADINIPNGTGQTPLSIAANKGNESGIRFLLAQRGIERDRPDSTDKTPLIHAAQMGHIKCIRLLLGSGVTVESRDREYKRTALSWAALNGHKVVVKALVKAEANLNHQDVRGSTPLALAAECGHETVVRILLESKANPDLADENEETPFEKARDQKMSGIVDLFNEILRM
ncbi:MAG: hypothetical protein LQ352_007495 [Teloschistes flavicans]|nr:MAG: hypothetical protein LQ352_007495 [Teloschistes flavicans]